MASKTVISKVLDADAVDGIIEIPQNRTLYVDGFTGVAAVCDDERARFIARDLKSVFEHYKPCKKNIILYTTDGGKVEENFYFHEIKDFDIERIIEQSPLLKTQKAQADRLNLDDVTSFEVLTENIVRIQNEIHDIEVAYRGLESFFLNAKQENFEFLTLMNVDKKKLSNPDSDDTLAVRNELEKNFLRLYLNSSYSMIVIPGYLGDTETVRMWAETAYRNKVIMVTDFKDCMSFENLKDELDNADLQGTQTYLGNIVMTANYLIAKRNTEFSPGGYDCCIPASSALAGRLANTEDWRIVQSAIDAPQGVLVGGYGTRIKLQNSDIASISTQGLIPICEESGIMIAKSDRTLYNGSLSALHNYAYVRVFDWIGKVFSQIYIDVAFRKWNSKLVNDFRQQVIDFLEDYKGSNGIIEDFNNVEIRRDEKSKNIIVSAEIKFPLMNQQFVLEKTGEVLSWEVYEWKQNIYYL